LFYLSAKRKVFSALTEDRSMTSIARENNLSVNTVQGVLASCSHRFTDNYNYLPEHLAFDEFKGVDKKLHFICLDGQKYEVVQILRNRYKKSSTLFQSLFNSRTSYNGRH
jgi:transposase